MFIAARKKSKRENNVVHVCVSKYYSFLSHPQNYVVKTRVCSAQEIPNRGQGRHDDQDKRTHAPTASQI